MAIDDDTSGPTTIPPVASVGSGVDEYAPDGAEVRLLVGARAGATKASLCEITIGPGQVSRPVRHRTVEEIWYVLGGRGEVWRCPPDAEPNQVLAAPVGPGDAVTIPTGWTFQFRASAAEPLRFLCYTCPSWPGPDEAPPSDLVAWSPTL